MQKKGKAKRRGVTSSLRQSVWAKRGHAPCARLGVGPSLLARHARNRNLFETHVNKCQTLAASTSRSPTVWSSAAPPATDRQQPAESTLKRTSRATQIPTQRCCYAKTTCCFSFKKIFSFLTDRQADGQTHSPPHFKSETKETRTNLS